MQPFKISMIFKKSTLEIFIHFLFAEMTQINWPQYKKTLSYKKLLTLLVSKPPKPISFIISISSSDFPAKSSAKKQKKNLFSVTNKSKA